MSSQAFPEQPDGSTFTVASVVIPAAPASAGLHITATPIGNLEDISLRALKTLAGVDMILCEDTRVTRRLLDRYRIRTPLKPYHDHNAERVRPGIVERLKQGTPIALVSDAGTPLISDPGYKLLREVLKAGISVHGLPGPSAPIMALAQSGLPSDRFLFGGFLPQKKGARCTILREFKALNATLIFFESARRVNGALADILETLGNREVVIARELTKLHEEFIRGPAEDLVQSSGDLKGEVTLLIGPPCASGEPDMASVDDALNDALSRLPAGRAASEVAKLTGMSRKLLYDRALELKNGSP